jgi:type IV secretory pathway VirB10-like protein
MGRVEAILAAASALSMALTMALTTAGCAAKKSKSTTTLAPPAPVAAPVAVKPVKEPLSIPQTQVQLPPPQPFNPEALTLPAPPPPEPPAPAPKPVRRATTTSPPKPEPAAPAAQPAEPERAPIQEIVPADERRRFQESADARKRETRQLLEQAKTHRLTGSQTTLVKRIQSFVAQSDDAEKRGDMRQADALAERGLVLAKELAGVQ